MIGKRNCGHGAGSVHTVSRARNALPDLQTRVRDIDAAKLPWISGYVERGGPLPVLAAVVIKQVFQNVVLIFRE